MRVESRWGFRELKMILHHENGIVSVRCGRSWVMWGLHVCYKQNLKKESTSADGKPSRLRRPPPITPSALPLPSTRSFPFPPPCSPFSSCLHGGGRGKLQVEVRDAGPAGCHIWQSKSGNPLYSVLRAYLGLRVVFLRKLANYALFANSYEKKQAPHMLFQRHVMRTRDAGCSLVPVSSSFNQSTRLSEKHRVLEMAVLQVRFHV